MSDLRSILLFLFLFPAISLAQTVHLGKDEIAYNGNLEVATTENLYEKVKSILLDIVKVDPDSFRQKKEKRELASVGSMRLLSTYQVVKTVSYSLKMVVADDHVSYEIDNIKLHVRQRGKKVKTIPSEVIIQGMEEGGKVAMETERQLNEIDMYIQKLIARMQRSLKS